MTDESGTSYETALAEGRAMYPGVRIGRPGRARTYWPTIAVMRVLKARLSISVTGSDNVLPGAGILIGNHVSAIDPVTAVITHWWRVTAFTKVEVFEKRGAIFFRLMGQIPLRRGDEESTRWAMDMAQRTLARGDKLGLYPEGTRSPDQGKLHRLHKRILIPVLQANPGVPAYAISTSYEHRPRRRTRVTIRISPPLPLDATTMTPDQLTDIVRDALLALGGQEYVDEYGRDVKAARQAAAEG